MTNCKEMLLNKYENIFKQTLKLYYDTGSGHIGGGLSILTTLSVLICSVMDTKSDKLIFSKGHNALALYSVLNATGYISKEEYLKIYKDNSSLGGHPPVQLTPFIPFSTGSLGHGLPLAAGVALAKKIKGEKGRVFCICGDGEWQEGSCWEALIFSINNKLSNMTILIDCNEWQGYDSCLNTTGIDTQQMLLRVKSFGANCISCDGHNISELLECLNEDIQSSTVPTVIFLNTIKGKGITQFENTLESHYKTLTKEIYTSLEKENINA